MYYLWLDTHFMVMRNLCSESFLEKAFAGETVKRVMRDKTYPLFHSIKYIGWVDGWKERKQDGWTDTEKWASGWEGHGDGWTDTDRRMNAWRGIGTVGWTDEWIDRCNEQMDEQTDRWVDTYLSFHLPWSTLLFLNHLQSCMSRLTLLVARSFAIL